MPEHGAVFNARQQAFLVAHGAAHWLAFGVAWKLTTDAGVQRDDGSSGAAQGGAAVRVERAIRKPISFRCHGRRITPIFLMSFDRPQTRMNPS
jgi:hypothetical protein